MTVLHVKIGNFAKLRQKSIFLLQGWFLVISLVCRQNKILWSLVMCDLAWSGVCNQLDKRL